MRVLVADDELPILTATLALLREHDLEAEGVSEASQIPQRLVSFQADALLQDVRMPGLDVRRHVSAIRRDPKLAHVRVVLFSAGMEVRDLAADLGVAVVEKPFKPETLLAALQVAPAARDG